MLSTSGSLSATVQHWQFIAGLLRETPGERSSSTNSASSGVLESIEAWLGQETGPPSIANLPLLTYQTAGGDGRRITPILGAWQAVYLALKLLDDVEDGDAGDNPSEAVNTGTGLLMAAQVVLRELEPFGVSPETAWNISLALSRAVMRACAGQQSDLVAGRSPRACTDPDTWLEIAGAKSGGLLGWAAWAGALVAGADEGTAARYREYGHYLGVLLQVADDFNDVWRDDGNSDLARGCLTLPVCYGLHVAMDKTQLTLVDLVERAAAGDRTAETKARELLIDLGAQTYLLAVAQMQYQQAVAALRSTKGVPVRIEQLVVLLDRVLPALKTVCLAE